MRGVHIGPDTIPELTLGYDVAIWADRYLLNPSDRDKPWRFTPEQLVWILNWFALDEGGRFTSRRGMLRRMKGWGKDPIGAVLCAVELVGPARFSHFDRSKVGGAVGRPVDISWIQTAAVSRDQTRNTMTLFPAIFSDRALEEYGISLGKEIIYARKASCRIEAVTSSWRSLEGARSTFVLKNETQNWLSNNEGHEMAAVIARNSAKMDARVLSIANAHEPGEDSDAERDFDAYLKISQGRSRGGGFLYDSREAPPDTDLTDRVSLAGGITAARCDSVWLDVDRLVEEVWDPNADPSASRRFYLNQIAAGQDAWIAPHEWDVIADPDKVVEEGEEITLGFDGSRTDDWSALTGCRVSDSHVWPIGIWDPEAYDGEIPRAAVRGGVARAREKYVVVGFYSDVHPWETDVDAWEQDFGEDLYIRASSKYAIHWDMRGAGRMREVTAAVEAFHDAIVARDFTHSGDSTASQHVYNARRWPNQYGLTFRKEHRESPRKVDWLSSAVLARKARQDYMALPERRKRRKRTGKAMFV